VLCFVVFGLSPILFQALSIGFARVRVVQRLIRTLEPLYAQAQFHGGWGMFTNHKQTGFVRAREWGYCLRREGLVVEEKALSGPLPLLMFLERHRFDDASLAASVVEHIIDTQVSPACEFDQFELVIYWKSLPSTPAKLRGRFPHADFLAAGFAREVAISCRV
jgi:hypothetical protein